MGCHPDDKKIKTMIKIDRKHAAAAITHELEPFIEMIYGIDSITQISKRRAGFRTESNDKLKRDALQRIESIIHNQKEYVEKRIKSAECFISCIEALDNETTALREALSGVKAKHNEMGMQLDRIPEQIKKSEISMDVAQDIRAKTLENFQTFGKPLKNLELELRERAEGLIRARLQDEDAMVSEFAKLFVEEHSTNANMEDMR